jgi:uncharacterized protein (TIGR03086 family)
MNDERATAAATGGIALLERAINYTLGCLQLVTPAALGHATPCADWDLRTLLAHLDDSLRVLGEAVEAGKVQLDAGVSDTESSDPEAGDPAADPVAAVRRSATHLLGALAGPRDHPEISIGGCPLTTGIVTATGAVEVAVHGWDVAHACGVDRPIPPPLAEEMLELSALLVSDADRPARFAAPVDAPPPADPGDRLVAFLGRRPYPTISRAA